MPEIYESSKGKNDKVSSKHPKANFFVDSQGKNEDKIPEHKHSPFDSFCFYPKEVKFINKDPEEKIILLLRRHPITNLRWVVIAFLMILTPSFFIFFPPYEILPSRFRFVINLIWYLITFSFVLEEFLKWFFQVNIITDERIIEVDFLDFLNREITDANIEL